MSFELRFYCVLPIIQSEFEKVKKKRTKPLYILMQKRLKEKKEKQNIQNKNKMFMSSNLLLEKTQDGKKSWETL